MTVDQILSLKNPVFSSYAFYAAIVILKMFLLAFFTSKERLTKKVFSNPEDVKGFADQKTGVIKFDDPCVERLRRNHLNDLENIPAFLFLGAIYAFTDPSLFAALWHFRIFVISRILHTICYQASLPQPSRALCYTVGLFVCISMAVQILVKTA